MSDETKSFWWSYENLPSGEPYDWGGAARNDHPDDNRDFHLDLGCGRLKKGRLGIDHFADPGVDLVMDLDNLHVAGYGDDAWAASSDPARMGDGEAGNPASGLIPVQGRLPFPGESIESIISHHCLEHIGDGFIRLMDECYRVLKPGGIFRIIVPLYPSHAAVADPDHKRYFLVGGFESFCGDAEGNSWLESFSTPYTLARFEKTAEDYTQRDPDPATWWMPGDAREMRVTLRKRPKE